MKVLFVGPSIYGVQPDFFDIVVKPPAAQGDIARAVLAGASAIGLVDGFFEAVAAPWHKEILFALSSGVTVLGSSSMGALRAAECARFGMRPVGLIAEAYCSGALDDDAAVALTHGPSELGYPPLSEPLVDVKPTLEQLAALGLISSTEHQLCWERACGLHFKDRTVEAMLSELGPDALAAYGEHRVNQKAEDALRLIAELRQCSPGQAVESHWAVSSSLFHSQVLPTLRREVFAEHD